MSFEPVTIELTEPVKYGAADVTEIVFSEPLRGKHLKGIDITRPSTDDLVRIASKLSKYPPHVIDELVVADYLRVIGTVSDFFGAGQETGEKE